MSQVDRSTGLVGNTGMKQPVKVAATTNITLSGEQTIDGVSCVTNDRVLVAGQTNTVNNGVYTVDTGTWERAADWDGTYDIVKGTTVRAVSGTANAGWWYVTTSDPITIGTTGVVFSRSTYLADSVPVHVSTIAALKALDISILMSSGDSALALGYYAIGDGGGGPDRYLVKGAAPGTYVDNGGSIIVPTGGNGSAAWLWGVLPFVHGRWFGIKADGSTDDITALNTVTQYAINSKITLTLPTGNINITAPWLMFVFSTPNYSYFNLKVTTDTVSYAQNSTGTNIVPSFNNGPALIIQGARRVHIDGVKILGLNDYEAALGGNCNNLLTESLFIGGGGGGHRDSRYSPYCGIAIDPFRNGLPVDGGYPGLSSYYTQLLSSSHIYFKNVTVRGFIVGVGLQLGGTGSNTDNITFENCEFAYHKVSLAISHAQCKGIRLNNCSVYGGLFMVDGANYGDQKGVMPVINGLNVGGFKYLFNVVGDAWANSIDSLYAESFLSLGYFGSGMSAVTSALNFSGSTFQIYQCDAAKQVDEHAYIFSNIVFNACHFVTSSTLSTPLRIFKDSNASVIFNGGSVSAQYIDTPQFMVHGSQEFPYTITGVSFNRVYIADGLNLSGRGQISGHYSSEQSIGGMASTAVPPGAMLQSANDISKLFLVSALRQVIPLGSILVTVAGNTATFVAPDAAIIRVGDVVWSDTSFNIRNYQGAITSGTRPPIGCVTNINGTTITLGGIQENFITGTYTLNISNWARIHAGTTGDTNSSISVTNVTQPSLWKTGTRIFGTGIPVGAYITNIVGSTFTISKAATATAIGIRLYDADIYVLTGTAL